MKDAALDDNAVLPRMYALSYALMRTLRRHYQEEEKKDETNRQEFTRDIAST